MADYDLLVLSPVEFENISKDLLEKKLKIDLEIFGLGRDKGIDLRYSKNKENTLIVQCKRYKNFTSLHSNLKKEVSKIKILNPKRYILTTTVSLNPEHKKKIAELLHPYIKTPSDILGKEQLNSLIGKNPEVEKKHYKLWMSSTAVLNNILHSKVLNQSNFELKNIKENLKTYAENKSFSEAIKLLHKNHFVVISGLPGIGKTTLARMLVYKLLGEKDFKEFIFLSGGIDEAYDLYEKDKKQLFLFDDFLGTNYLEHKISRNEDNRLLEFIKIIRSSKKSALIMTTREYILKQAQGDFRLFEDENFENSKYIIDLSKYTKLVRAQILYNHLFSAEIPQKYIDIFLNKKVYRSLVDHKKYNPRLIETILKEKPWESLKPEDFPNALIDYFDNPNSIWEKIYENEISENAQSILEVTLTATAPIKLNDLIEASLEYIYKKRGMISRSKVEKALKELDGTFLSTSQVDDENTILVNYQNPSIYDFLKDYYKGRHQIDLVPLIESALYLNQLTEVFITKNSSLLSRSGKIVMEDKIEKAITKKIISEFDSLGWSAVSGNAMVELKTRLNYTPKLLDRMNKVLFVLGLKNNSEIKNYMLSIFKDFLKGKYTQHIIYTSEIMDLLDYFSPQLSKDEVKKALTIAVNHIANEDEVERFHYAEVDYPDAFEAVLEEVDVTTCMEFALECTIESLEDEEVEDYLENVKWIIENYNLDEGRLQDLISDRMHDLAQQEDGSSFYENDAIPRHYPRTGASSSSGGNPNIQHIPSEDEIIDDMFGSLK